MEVRLAETFLKVAELGNITKSAESLGYSQAAVTAQIKQLEADLGVQLFDRIGRGIQLTDTGREFINYATQLVRASQEADAFAVDESSPTGQLTIMAGSSVTFALLPKLLIGFKRRYPGVNIDVDTVDSRESQLEGLKKNSHDFMLDIGVRREYAGCTKAAERKEEFVFVCNSADPLASRKKVTLKDLFSDKENNPFIFHGGDDTEVSIRGLLAEKNIYAKNHMEFSASIAIVNLLLEGYGRSMLPRFIVERELERGTLSILNIKENVPGLWSQLYYNSDKWLNPAMTAFINYTKAAFKSVTLSEE